MCVRCLSDRGDVRLRAWPQPTAAPEERCERAIFSAAPPSRDGKGMPHIYNQYTYIDSSLAVQCTCYTHAPYLTDSGVSQHSARMHRMVIYTAFDI